MAISWGPSYTQSGGSPKTLYQYRAEVSDRLPNSVRVKLYIKVRLKNYSSYFSFRVGHECKVNGIYQSATIKDTRKYWGHQWSGSYNAGGGSYWQQGEYDYAGDNWHGWYKVFDGVVPCRMEDTTVTIVPCITRPPICGLGGGGIYARNDLDKTNWRGARGVWRPWSADEQRGSWANRVLPVDAAFLNNRWLEPLNGGAAIPKYNRPGRITGITVIPQSIDVANQDRQAVTVSWAGTNNATGYKVWINKGSRQVYLGTTTATKYVVNPKNVMKIDEIMDGDKFTFTVLPYDRNNVEAESSTTSTPVTYTEVKSLSPSTLYVVGKKQKRNEILFRGEKAIVNYSGQFNGSYPIARYELVRLSDGAKVVWSTSQARGVNPTNIVRDIPGIKKPNVNETFELRVYNTKNRPVYLKNGRWLRVNIHYYGGVLYVYDIEKRVWHEGIAYVYDKKNDTWHEAEAVYVRRSGQWRTL